MLLNYSIVRLFEYSITRILECSNTRTLDFLIRCHAYPDIQGIQNNPKTAVQL